ncbi:MAG: YlxR family protein [Chloroflexi bacterium]|nr:YlxR family protein [Chloroflexota bacterium]
MQAPRHVPQRHCIICGEPGEKRGLLRIVREPSGAVSADPTGKRAGRGAYLCEKASCREAVLKKGRLESVLKVKLSQEDMTRLAASLSQTSVR